MRAMHAMRTSDSISGHPNGRFYSIRHVNPTTNIFKFVDSPEVIIELSIMHYVRNEGPRSCLKGYPKPL